MWESGSGGESGGGGSELEFCALFVILSGSEARTMADETDELGLYVLVLGFLKYVVYTDVMVRDEGWGETVEPPKLRFEVTKNWLAAVVDGGGGGGGS
ncbi:hypothetical protein M0804_007376 [Polistes exclamans]|nr:hypothetical protein M0804_007376 [Polistes exclamans]